MIALCREHADKADHGSFTDDQLHALKREGKGRAQEVRGRLDWMRQDLLAVVGGNFYHGTDVILQIGSVRCIWFERDEDDGLLLNFRMPTVSGRPRAQVDNNFWSVVPSVDEVICPPNGRLVEVSYGNGDKFRIEFFNVTSPADLATRYPDSPIAADHVRDAPFPITAVEVWETAAGTSIEFGPHFSRLPGNNILMGNFIYSAGGVAIFIGASEDDVARLFPDVQSGDE